MGLPGVGAGLAQSDCTPLVAPAGAAPECQCWLWGSWGICPSPQGKVLFPVRNASLCGVGFCSCVSSVLPHQTSKVFIYYNTYVAFLMSVLLVGSDLLLSSLTVMPTPSLI